MIPTLTHHTNVEGSQRIKALPGWLAAPLLALVLLTAIWTIRPSGDPPAEPARIMSEPTRPDAAAGTGPAAPATAVSALSSSATIDPDRVSSGSSATKAPAAVRPVVAADGHPDSQSVLFLTIVGDQTYYQWGWVGDRPPRIDGLGGAGGWPGAAEPVEYAADVGFETVASNPDVYGGAERPYGPEPQECPRTLPPGSTQATANELRRESGCRYLSTCSAETEECTWHYQGRDRLTPT